MKKLILLIILLLFTACSTEPMKNPHYTIKMYSGCDVINEWQGSLLEVDDRY